MVAAAGLVLFSLIVTSVPPVSVGFCSATTAGSAHHQPSGTLSRHASVPIRSQAAAAADNAPTTSRNPTEEMGDDGDSNSSERFESFAAFLMATQADICRQAEDSDGKATFCTDRWEREGASKVHSNRAVLVR